VTANIVLILSCTAEEHASIDLKNVYIYIYAAVVVAARIGWAGTAVRGGDHEATDGATPTTVGRDVAGGRKAAMPPLGKFNSAWDISNHA
jgi:hypothetical protein